MQEEKRLSFDNLQFGACDQALEALGYWGTPVFTFDWREKYSRCLLTGGIEMELGRIKEHSSGYLALVCQRKEICSALSSF
jgi:hypothetical protein